MSKRIHWVITIGLFLSFWTCGCGGDAESSEPTPPTATALVEVARVTAGDGPILRYARDRVKALRDAAVADLELPLDGQWVPFHHAKVDFDGGLLRVESADRPAFVQLPVSADAVWYDRVEIEMRTTVGAQCLFKWATDTAPDFALNPGVYEPIIADGEFHTYTINLNHYTLAEWAGTLRAVEFWPSGETMGDADIRRFRLLRASHETPRRITIQNQTHEAAFGSQPPWHLRVPQRGLLSLHYGLLPEPAIRYAGDGAQFTVTARNGAGQTTLLLDEALTPQGAREWKSASIDLSAYSGQEIDLLLAVNSVNDAAGDLAFWGSPVVIPNGQRDDAPPVLLISLDTLRADHLSSYGYERNTSPNIDRLAEDAVLFEHAIAAETWTLPSHMTIFTGLYPKNHGVTGNALLPESRLTLGDALSEAGYLSAGFTGLDWWLMPYRGFAQGFDLYNHARPTTRHIYATLPLAMNWLRQHDTNRFFLFFHAFDIHSKVTAIDSFQLPYETGDPEMVHFSKGMAPPSFNRPGLETRATYFLQRGNEGKLQPTQDELAYMMAVYDDCIRMVDMKLGELFDSLRDRGLYDDALIVLLADHGESFFEHEKFLHQTVYEENCHVPLIVKLPKNAHAGKRVEDQVVLADVLPTIAAILDIDTGDAEFDGRSLLPLIESGDAPHSLIYVQREEQRAVRTNAIKQIRYTDSAIRECYDLLRDPEETASVCDAIPDDAEALFAKAHDAFFTVPSGGWHVAFRGGSDEWDIKLTLSSPESRITRIAFLHADRRDDTLIERQSQSAFGFTANLGLKNGEEEECVVSVEQSATATGGETSISDEMREQLNALGYGAGEIESALATGRANIIIESNLPFSVNSGTDTVSNYTALLDPLNPNLQSESFTTAPPGEPSVRIWYVAPSESESPAALSDEEAQQLGDAIVPN